MDKVYQASCESKWYAFWLSKKLFHGVPDKGGKKPFSIVIPPPNITGSLHMGHAVNNILQDVITRYFKMAGFETCWIPGTDHGGIATQNVVEKALLAEGKSRHDLGREKFLERMKTWRDTTGNAILEQLKKLGCSCDWDRTCFTMDDKRNEAVFEAFRILYEKGLIYRGERMVQWCPRCNTALADIEVEHVEEIGKLWHMIYPFVGQKEGIVVATTRPETMLGDTAVAVHPDDHRYQKLIGKRVALPLTGRTIPIVADEFVDKTFGSGAVKVTPAHDPNDFEIGIRHNLAAIKVIDFEGKMTKEAGPAYAGLDRYACRKKILKDLEEKELLLETKDHPHAIGRCYRCNESIEPLVSKQWFLSMKDMAHKGLTAVKKDGTKKRIEIIPASWEGPYTHWLENLKDWCISRQIWWGHRIPLWYCTSYEKDGSSCTPVFGVEKPKKCPACGDSKLTQDPDVLDTWFSSALWPFSVFGWPEKTKELSYFYPTAILATGHEILYLWVARMIMMGLELVGDIPFEKVLIHGIVRDKHGKKMSKSLGNVIDPLDIISMYGTDALRYTMVSASVMGRDMQLADDTFIGSRNFTNKLWNVSRFILMNMADYDGSFKPEEEDLELADRWIIYRYAQVVDQAHNFYRTFNPAQVCRLMHSFIWSEFCDWYVELVKSRFSGGGERTKKTVQYVLAHIMDGLLKILHPVMPFITEEIWDKLKQTLTIAVPGKEKEDSLFDPFDFSRSCLLESEQPKGTKKAHAYAASMTPMQTLQDLITGIRNIRSEMNVQPGKRIEALFSIPSSEMRSTVESHRHYFTQLARVDKMTLSENVQKPDGSAAVVVGSCQVFLPLSGLIDIDKEKLRLTKELEQTTKEIGFSRKKLDNKQFVSRAPEQEVEKVRARIDLALEKQKRIQSNLKGLSK